MLVKFVHRAVILLPIFVNSACSIHWGHRQVVSDVNFYLKRFSEKDFMSEAVISNL